MERVALYENDLNLKETELRLGLPGTTDNETTSPISRNNKRSSSEMMNDDPVPSPKAQVVGWPPVRSYRKKVVEANKKGEMYVKVSMDGAPYLRKIDVKVYKGYTELVKGLEGMFKCNIGVYCEREGYNNNNVNGCDYAPTYEDKDGDWMLVGDVPWEMFINSCKRLRLIKGSDVKGLGCRL